MPSGGLVTTGLTIYHNGAISASQIQQVGRLAARWGHRKCADAPLKFYRRITKMMNYKDVITLLNAGYTRDEIKAMGEQPQPQPQPQPKTEPKPQPQPKAETKDVDEFQNLLDRFTQRMAEQAEANKKMMQEFFRGNDHDAETEDDWIKSLLK